MRYFTLKQSEYMDTNSWIHLLQSQLRVTTFSPASTEVVSVDNLPFGKKAKIKAVWCMKKELVENTSILSAVVELEKPKNVLFELKFNPESQSINLKLLSHGPRIKLVSLTEDKSSYNIVH